MKPRRFHCWAKRTIEYKALPEGGAMSFLRFQCTRAKLGRTVKRHEKQWALDIAKAQAHSRAAQRDRRRRKHLMEGSFADAANNHHFRNALAGCGSGGSKAQDYLIASDPERAFAGAPKSQARCCGAVEQTYIEPVTRIAAFARSTLLLPA